MSDEGGTNPPSAEAIREAHIELKLSLEAIWEAAELLDSTAERREEIERVLADLGDTVARFEADEERTVDEGSDAAADLGLEDVEFERSENEAAAFRAAGVPLDDIDPDTYEPIDEDALTEARAERDVAIRLTIDSLERVREDLGHRIELLETRLEIDD